MALPVFFGELATSMGKAFGPDVIKAIWAKMNGDNSQDQKLKVLGKERLKELNQLQQIRNDITEYQNLKETLSPDYKGPALWPAIRKQSEKRFKKLENILGSYYDKYPNLKLAVTGQIANPQEAMAKIDDSIKGEITKMNAEVDQAAKAIKEGKPGTQSPDDQRYKAYSPEQADVLNKLSQLGLKGLEGNNFDFAPIEEEARAGFKQKTIPTIAERFTQFGGPGSASAQRSSAFPQLLSQAGADLERSLAGMKQGYNLKREGNFANIANIGLKPQYGYAGPLIGGLDQNKQQAGGDKFIDYLFSEEKDGTPIGKFFGGLMDMLKAQQKPDDGKDKFKKYMQDYINENRDKGGQISDYDYGIPGGNTPAVEPYVPSGDLTTPGSQNLLSLRQRLGF